MASLSELKSFLDAYLRLSEITDDPGAVNGLQLEAGGEIESIACAVDASEASIEEAIARKAELLLVHHGLLWGGNRALTGAHARKLSRCFGARLSVYSAHLPLDVHPQVGNNAGLLRVLGLTAERSFALWKGTEIGLTAPCDLSLEELAEKVRAGVGEVKLAGKGPSRTRLKRLGVITGTNGGFVSAAAKAGCDALLTGEGPHHSALDAEELGLHLLLAGHYRTEVFGVQALGAKLAERFGLKAFFIGRDSGL